MADVLLDQETLRFIFGLKLRGLRLDRGLSLKELSRKTGLSPSYLNEIEKGKKYPKNEKIMQLAQALGEDYDDLISLKLKKELSLVTQLIEKNVFSGMPFEIFGIPAATVFSLIAERPKKMSALVGTLLEIARGHNITVDDFFYATLRSYLDMHQNYFPSIEEKVETLRSELKINVSKEAVDFYIHLKELLKQKYNIETTEVDFAKEHQDLEGLYFLLKTDPKGQLRVYINSKLGIRERTFIVARELGAAFMKIKNRPQTSLIKNLDSFEQLFNHFSVSYFASALLVPKEDFVKKLEDIFYDTKWNQTKFNATILGYHCPIESVFHRMTQLLPKYFGLEHIFFLRFDYDFNRSRFKMVRELHLTELHSPHGVVSDEHYCQRWITTRLLNDLRKSGENYTAGIQKSRFYSTDNEYLNISMAFQTDLDSRDLGCVTLGVLLNQKARTVLKFLNDSQIVHKIVADTCEKCAILDCQERLASMRRDLMPDNLERVRRAIELLY